MAFAEAEGEQQRLPGAGAATVPSRCWKGACAVTSCCSGGRLEGRAGQNVFRKLYPWPKKFTFDQNTHLKTHEFTFCFEEVWTSIHHRFWHSGVTLLGEDVKHYHKAGNCNICKPPEAGTVLGQYWASGGRSGACWHRQKERLRKQLDTEQRREQRALISGCKHKGGKGQKKKEMKYKGGRGLWRKRSGCRLGRNKKEKEKKSKSTIINVSYPGRNIQPKGLSFPPSTSSKQFPLIRKRILDTSPVACPWKGLSSRGNGNEQWWCYSSRAVTGNTATKTQQAKRRSPCQALGVLSCSISHRDRLEALQLSLSRLQTAVFQSGLQVTLFI